MTQYKAIQSKKITCLHIEDHPLIYDAMSGLMSSMGLEVELVLATRSDKALKVLKDRDIDLVLLDLYIPGEKKFENIYSIRQMKQNVPIIAFSSSDLASDVLAVERAGARGFISKAASSTEIKNGLQTVLDGNTYFPKVELEHHGVIADNDTMEFKRGGVSKRQLKVLQFLNEGLANKEIAQQLSISDGTVRQHLHAIYRKLGVRNRVEAVNKANLLKLI